MLHVTWSPMPHATCHMSLILLSLLPLQDFVTQNVESTIGYLEVSDYWVL